MIHEQKTKTINTVTALSVVTYLTALALSEFSNNSKVNRVASLIVLPAFIISVASATIAVSINPVVSVKKQK